MNRPKCITTCGTTTAGTSAAVGTGAFVRVSSDPSVSVQVADALGAVTSSNECKSECATTAGDGTVTADFTEADAGGTSLGTDSVCESDDIRCYGHAPSATKSRNWLVSGGVETEAGHPGPIQFQPTADRPHQAIPSVSSTTS